MSPSNETGAPSVARDLAPSDETDLGCLIAPSVDQEGHVRCEVTK